MIVCFANNLKVIKDALWPVKVELADRGCAFGCVESAKADFPTGALCFTGRFLTIYFAFPLP